jgi:hypothetical protein
MRARVDRARLERFMEALGLEAREPTRVYFTGGATAVLHGWRDSTIDVDLKLVPDSDRLLRSLPRLKEELEINVELASPDDFIPPLPGWRERSPSVATVGSVSFHHYDFYAQALSKIERGHANDLLDVEAMLARGLVTKDRLRALFAEIEPALYRYPAIDPASFRSAVEAVARDL